MIESIKSNFSVQENQFIIEEMSKKYQLSSLEYIALIDILIYYYGISSSPNTLTTVQIICERILQYREQFKVNQTGEFFTTCLRELVTREMEIDEQSTINNLQKLVNEGLIFHSFNAAFFDKINTQGLVVKEKPWSLDEVEDVRKIFYQKENYNVFGLYQGKTATPVFFADTLISSPYYGLSSPTFFRKFIENKPEYFNVFLNRDYSKAKESIEQLCVELSDEERNIVFNFFNKYWQLFTNGELPYVAITTKEKMGIKSYPVEQFPNESLVQYYLRCLLSGRNHMFKENIDREKLELFSYSELTFAPKVKEKNI